MTYCCGYCDAQTASALQREVPAPAVFSSGHQRGVPIEPDVRARPTTSFVVCNCCGNGSAIAIDGTFCPSPKLLPSVSADSASILRVWEEIRAAYQACAWLPVVLACRTLLMHLAVEETDLTEDDATNFAICVEHLVTSAGVPGRKLGPLATRIRKNGNKAGHELEEVTAEIAEDTVMLTRDLLRTYYPESGHSAARAE